ncbi:MAG TPA: hypothetical protein VEV19_09335 [Ktedonobacteraceae bacterium]|nr:hypothetical protein [Ktedonobacteraceae bacterium]
MDFTDTLWTFILTMCLIALMVEGATLFRILFLTRQSLARYLLLLLPIIGCLWSFAVLLHALNAFMTFPTYIDIHLNATTYHMLRAEIDQATIACQIQSAIALVIFLVLIVIERKTLPHVEQTPIWLLAKDQTIRNRANVWQEMAAQTRMPMNRD